MASNETCFPRGGTFAKTSKREHQVEKEKDLFKTSAPPAKKPKKEKKRVKTKTKDGKKSKKTTDDDDGPNSGVIEVLTLKNLTKGMLIVGCIKDIHEYELDICLPYGITGVVPITNISTHYTHVLKQLSREDQDTLQNIKSLETMFQVGMSVRCKVMDIEDEAKGKHRVKLSVDPTHVNHMFSHSTLKTGMVLSGSIISREDHGYRVDLGLHGITGFLKNSAADKYLALLDEENLGIGQYMTCLIHHDNPITTETRSVKVVVDPGKVGKALTSSGMKLNLDTLVPGMKVQAKVTKITPLGLTVKFLSYIGTIPATHMEESYSQYNVADELEATILYIQPTSKVVTLTLLPHLMTFDPATPPLFGDLKRGDMIEQAEVTKVSKPRGVYLKIGEIFKALAYQNQLSDKGAELGYNRLSAGKKVKCRILDFDYSDNVVVVSLKKSVLTEKYIEDSSVEPGAIVDGSVKSVRDKGVVVRISRLVSGFIPKMHLSDVTISHPEKRFAAGDKVKCRVLKKDETTGRPVLTHKKSLVKTKLPIVTSFEQAGLGLVIEGFITMVTKKGLLVVFYNDTKGWVPPKEMSMEKVSKPEEVFYVGQVVKCRVISVDTESQKIKLSLKQLSQEAQPKKTKKSSFEIGQMLEGTISEKTDFGLNIQVSGTKVFLPKRHLSDFVCNCDMLYEQCNVGGTLSELMVTNTSGYTPIVTKKNSLHELSKNNSFVSQFSDLKEGMLLPGYIKKKMEYGGFVDTLNGLVGLVPNKSLCDHRVLDPSTLYTEGQSVIAKVTNVDEDKERFLLSLRMSDCYQGDITDAVSLLDSYLQECGAIKEKYKDMEGSKSAITKYKTGDVIKMTVTKKTEDGVLLQTQDGTKGFATFEHVIDFKGKEGSVVDALVLYVDLESCCLELSISKPHVKAVQHLSDDKFSKAKEGQVLKADTLLVKEHFILALLKSHATGRLVYLPGKKHLNDVFGHKTYGVGQVNPVIIKSVSGSHILGCLELDEGTKKSTQQTTQPEIQQFTPHNLVLGDVKTARVKSIEQYSVTVMIGQTPGQVHISEVTEKIKQGINPLAEVKEGATIKVKVIGFRNAKTRKLLNADTSDRTAFSKAIPQCTMKKSKVKVSKHQPSDLPLNVFEEGDKVPVFVNKVTPHNIFVTVTHRWRGKVAVYDLTDDIQTWSNPTSNVTEGQAYMATVIGKQELNNHLDLSIAEPQGSVSEGSTARGFVLACCKSRGLIVQLPDKYRGTVSLTDLADEYIDNPMSRFETGHVVKCVVVKCSARHREKTVLSMRESRLHVKPMIQMLSVRDPEMRSMHSIKSGQKLRGFVTSNSKHGIFVSLGADITGRVSDKHMCDEPNIQPKFAVGKVVTVYVISVNKKQGTIVLSLLSKDTGLKQDAEGAQQKVASLDEDRKRKLSGVTGPGVDVKRAKVDDEDSGVDSDADDKTSKPSKKLPDVPRLALSSGFSWNNTLELPVKNQSDDSSSESDQSDTEDNQRKLSKKTRQEKVEQRKQEEKMIREQEMSLMDGDRRPESADEFDRLVLQSPDSSVIWLSYMAYHLQTTEIEKARTVAERALKTINFREEQEKLNVWVAYMNLENMYGSHEQLVNVFERALKQNEPINVYQQLINIYTRSDKIEAAEGLYNTMVKRFSQNPSVWTDFGLFCFKHCKVDQGRKLLQRSLKSLDKRDHVQTISKFAQMEFKEGEPERGKTMFENILSTYPKRIDLWSVYIDMVVKMADLAAARQLFERAIHLNLSVKKIQSLFKKYMEFEEKHGTESSVEQVKAKAMQYMEEKSSAGMES